MIPPEEKKDKNLPAVVVSGGVTKQTTQDSLVARGLEAVKHSLLVTTESEADELYMDGQDAIENAEAIGDPQYFSDAIRLFRLAAEMGHISAQKALGNAYSQGLWGVPEDRVEAVKWIGMAAVRGNVEAIEWLCIDLFE